MNTYVARWQRAIGVVDDGKFGPKTLAASFAASAAEPATEFTQSPWELRDSDLDKLAHAEPGLRRFVFELAKRSRFRFGVHDCLRSLQTQRKLVADGRSWTMRSLHLEQPDGFSHAVDLVWLNEEGNWDWSNAEQYQYLARLGVEVAEELGFPLRNLGIAIGKDWYHYERTRGA